MNTAAYTVADYVSTTPFFLDSTDGNNETSVAKYLDSALGGNSDWYLSPVVDENFYACNESYCKYQCIVYRNLLSEDKVTDVQFSKSGTLKAQGGYRMWPSRLATLASAKQGISPQMDVTYGGTFSMWPVIILFTNISFLS